MDTMRDLRSALAVLTRFRDPGRADVNESAVRIFLPVIGAGLGIVLGLCALLLVWLAGLRSGTLIGAAAVFVLWRWLGGGKVLGGFVALLEAGLPDRPGDPLGGYIRPAVFQMALLATAVCIGVLIHVGQILWLVVVCVLEATTVADMARPRGDAQEEETTWLETYGHWLVSVPIVLVCSGLAGAFLVGLVALIIAWLLPASLERGFLRAMPPATAPWGAAACTEGLLLLLAVLAFLSY